MKRGAVVGLVVAGVVVLGVGAGAVAALGGAGAGDAAMAPSMTQSTAATTAAPAPEQTASGPEGEAEPADDGTGAGAASPGAYVDYSESALASAEGTRVLFFHASWCPKCRALEASILDEGVPDGITILKVDYDTATDLRQRYDVRQQTTLVALDADGDATASFVAYDDPTVDAALVGVGVAG